jgi:pimeloyl-ACP methyl ester carboxylesterase
LRDRFRLQQLRKSWYIYAFQLPRLPEWFLLRNHAHEIGRMLRGAATQKDAFPREVTARYQEAMSKPGAMTAALNYYRALLHNSGTRTYIGHNFLVEAPTLVIWGEQDIALDIHLLEGLDRWVPNLRIKRLPDSGHWVQQEQPERVNQYLLEFLQETAASHPHTPVLG